MRIGRSVASAVATHTALKTGVHGVGTDYLAKTSLSAQDLGDGEIPDALARDLELASAIATEVAARAEAIGTHSDLASAHHTKFTNTEHDVVARHPLANLNSAVCSETEALALIPIRQSIANLATSIDGATLNSVPASYFDNLFDVVEAASILNEVSLTTPKAASIITHANLQAASAASIFAEASLSEAKAASIFSEAGLTPAKAASIFDHANIIQARARSIFDHANFSLTRKIPILVAMTTPTKIVDALTITKWRVNPATGTPNNPDRLNDGDTGVIFFMTAIDQYCEVAFGETLLFKQWRHFGHANNNEDGVNKIQFWNLDSEVWEDWETGIPTRLASWSDWAESASGMKMTNKIRWVCTTVDSCGNDSIIGEVEVKF